VTDVALIGLLRVALRLNGVERRQQMRRSVRCVDARVVDVHKTAGTH
jgi:hypothetical protein